MQASAGQLKKRRSGSMDAAAGRPAKRAKKAGAARAASLNTVLAAVEERAGRAGSGAMDASVGCAPTTVEDCLKASSFGAIRKVGHLPPQCRNAPLTKRENARTLPMTW